MKRNLLFLMIMLFTASLASSQNYITDQVVLKDKSISLKEKPAANNNNSRNVEDCYIEAQTVSYTAGTTVDLDFYLYYYSPDWEYIDGASITFPSGVSVNSAQDCGGMAYNGETGDGVTVTWGDIAGGSGYGPVSSDQYWTVNVTIDPSFTGPISMDWFIMGDWYGGTPHSVSGQTEIQEPAACPAPNAQTESNITMTSVDLSWSGSDAAWNIEYGPAGFAQGSGTQVTGVTNPYTLSGLTAGTYYDWYVQADCGDGSTSTWTGPSTFSTECDANSVFPWTEGFEGMFLPICWSKIVHDGNDITQNNNNTTPGGAHCAMFSSYSTSSDYNQYLFSPAMTINADNRLLTFNAAKYYYGNDILEWGISTTTNPDDFTWTSVELEAMTWNIYQEFIPKKYIGQTVYIGFHYYGDYQYYVYLDDVTITSTPPVPLSDWAIYAGVFFILSFLVIRFRRRLA